MAVPYSVETVRALERKFQEQNILRPFRRPPLRARDRSRIRRPRRHSRRPGPGQARNRTIRRRRLSPGRSIKSAPRARKSGRRYPGPGDRPDLRPENPHPASGFEPPHPKHLLRSRLSRAVLAPGHAGRGPLSGALAEVHPPGGEDRIRLAKTASSTSSPRSSTATSASCGELSEWVDGRMWRFEVDDDLDARRAWKPGRPDDGAGSPEYRTKRAFMDRLVRLMRRMGAVELARQYEWWSLKSQPNAMKRTASDPDPEGRPRGRGFPGRDGADAGDAAVPGRYQARLPGARAAAGSSSSTRAISKSSKNSSPRIPSAFADMAAALDELKREDRAYRDSLIDITYHHVRLFGRRLRRVDHGRLPRKLAHPKYDRRADRRHGLKKAASSRLSSFFWPFLALATPLLFVFAWPGPVWWKYPLWLAPARSGAVPPATLGPGGSAPPLRQDADKPGYFLRAGRARIAEALIRWHRAGRVSDERALKIAAPALALLSPSAVFLPARRLPSLSDRQALFQASGSSSSSSARSGCISRPRSGRNGCAT